MSLFFAQHKHIIQFKCLSQILTQCFFLSFFCCCCSTVTMWQVWLASACLSCSLHLSSKILRWGRTPSWPTLWASFYRKPILFGIIWRTLKWGVFSGPKRCDCVFLSRVCVNKIQPKKLKKMVNPHKVKYLSFMHKMCSR